MPNERDKEFAASTTLFVNIYYYHMFQSILLLSSYFILKVVFYDEIFTFELKCKMKSLKRLTN